MVSVLILAAGRGSRLSFKEPKALLPLGGQPMIGYLLDTVCRLAPQQVGIVLHPEMDTLRNYLDAYKHTTELPIQLAYQADPLGTGHAVCAALDLLSDDDHPTIILFADTPFISAAFLQSALQKFIAEKLDILTIGMAPPFPNQYGRFELDSQERPTAIIEAQDILPHHRLHPQLCNAGMMIVRSSILKEDLPQLPPKKEYYLTDLISLIYNRTQRVGLLEAPVTECEGINTPADRARLEGRLQQKWRDQCLQEGVHLLAPETNYFAYDTRIEAGATLHPFVVCERGVKIEKHATILSYCRLAECTIEAGARIGPFAHIRPGTLVAAEAHIGNFVELKNAKVGQGTKINHLSYMGDCVIGQHTNIGAGTIICNYDGFNKHTAYIGDYVMVGGHTTIISPLRIDSNSLIAAGSVITQDVPESALTISRVPQTNRLHGAARYRQRRQSAIKDFSS